MLFHNYEHSPTFYSQTYMRCDPKFIKDLQWFGVNLMACANNHCTDFGENGVLTNNRNLDEAGMVHAGTGKHYADALFPAYLDTAKGRVALISALRPRGPTPARGTSARTCRDDPASISFVGSTSGTLTGRPSKP